MRISVTEVKLAELEREKGRDDKDIESIRIALQTEKEKGDEIARELKLMTSSERGWLRNICHSKKSSRKFRRKK